MAVALSTVVRYGLMSEGAILGVRDGKLTKEPGARPWLVESYGDAVAAAKSSPFPSEVAWVETNFGRVEP